MKMPPRLTFVGDLERADHFHLPPADCFFWGEYTPFEHTDGKKWDYSATNRLITNFKKRLDRKGLGEWKYKTNAIAEAGANFAQFWKWNEMVNNVALVPIPPSKAASDPMYDQRMLDVLNVIAARTQLPLDIRDCLRFSGKLDSSHLAAARPTPEDLYRELSFSKAAGKWDSPPRQIYLFDDVLTTGAHFRAASKVLGEWFPGVPIVGNFIARRVVPNPFDEVDLDL